MFGFWLLLTTIVNGCGLVVSPYFLSKKHVKSTQLKVTVGLMLFMYLSTFLTSFLSLINARQSINFSVWMEFMYFITAPTFFWMLFYVLVAFRH